MANALYVRAAATAKRLITKYGRAASLVQVTAGAYNPATGTTASSAATTWPCVAAVFDYPAKEIDGTMILRGDKSALFSIAGAVPKASDSLVIGGVTHTVIDSKPLDPGGLVVMYTLQLRVGA